MANKIILAKNGEGSTTGSITSTTNAQTHEISGEIAKDSIVVVMVYPAKNDGTIIKEESGEKNPRRFDVSLVGPGVEETPKMSLGYSATYFKTTQKGTFSVGISYKNYMGNYKVTVAVVHAIKNFIPADCQGYSQYNEKSFMISDGPEYLSGACTADKDYKYLCRGLLNAKARVYYEHYNELGKAMKFGVLLWNLDDKPITVSLDTRCIVTAFTGADIQDVGKAFFTHKIESDRSGFSGTVILEKYDASNPGKSAMWVALSSIPASTVTYNGFFNGVVALRLTANGKDYYGNKLICDTYIMSDTANEETVKANISKMTLFGAMKSEYIRGSANGAVLVATINDTETVSSDKPYSILLAGHSVPHLQPNELLPLYMNSVSNGVVNDPKVSLANGYNFGTVYRLIFENGFTSSVGKIKIKLSANPATNAGAAIDPYSGVHFAGYVDGDSDIFSGTVFSGQYAEIPVSIKSGEQFVLNLVICAMSCMPAEVSFYA